MPGAPGTEPTAQFGAVPGPSDAAPFGAGPGATTPFGAGPGSSATAPFGAGPGASGAPAVTPPFPPAYPSAAPGVSAPPPFPAPYGPPAGGAGVPGQPGYGGAGQPGAAGAYGPPGAAGAYGPPGAYGAPGSGQPAYGVPGSGQPPYGVPGAGQPPYGAGQPPYGQPLYGAPFGQPAGKPRSRAAVIAAVVVGVLVIVAGIGAVGSIFALRSDDTTSSRPAIGPVTPEAGGLPDPALSGEPEVTEEAEQGPEASAYPAEKVFDLNRVCDENVYYPDQPKRTGKAPHPVVLLVNDGDGIRSSNGTYYFDQGLSDSVKNTWAPESPAKVQMVACLDRVKVGGKIRSCKYDDPKGLVVTLMKASWRLRVYEAATGKVLLDKAMAGDDKACPYFVLYGPDKKIYSKVSDRAAVAALRNLVKK
ncbi:hypothetical protein AB0M02_28060 [Actinoplanes sp. NPDC051861]|uniref:hypothetical protein n=1 Tax=Actinoplanes sp. NPDC051861 TaxID=3155170 RepID=UPI00343FDC1A